MTAQAVYQSQVNALGSAIPFIVAPTGTMANNGVITLGTALPAIFSGGAFVNLPANAIVAGSAAGWYWTVFSTTAIGVVFNNTYVSGPVSAPAVPTPFVTTGPGAYTGVTTLQTGPSIQLPAPGVVGQAAALRLSLSYSHNNSAGTKVKTVTLGGTTIFTESDTTTKSYIGQVLGFEQNSPALMATAASQTTGGLGAVNTDQTYNTAANVTTGQPTLAFTFQLNTATDFMILNGWLAELFGLSS